jgi:hypothetical protein
MTPHQTADPGSQQNEGHHDQNLEDDSDVVSKDCTYKEQIDSKDTKDAVSLPFLELLQF